MVYTANWVIIYHLPPIKGTNPNSYWSLIPRKELPTTGKNGTIWRHPHRWKLNPWSCGAQAVVNCVVNKKWIGRTMSRGMPKHLKMKRHAGQFWRWLDAYGVQETPNKWRIVTSSAGVRRLCHSRIEPISSFLQTSNDMLPFWTPCNGSPVAIPCCTTTAIFVLLLVNLLHTWLDISPLP